MLVGDPRLTSKPVSLADQFVGLVPHALQQGNRRRRRDTRPLEIEDVTLLPFDLHAHAGDLGLDVAEEPSQGLGKGQSLTSPSSRPFQYVTRFALTLIRTIPGVSTPLSNHLSRSLVQCCWKAALSRMSSAVPSTAT